MDYELYHYGVKGMKWGIRRYQNPDGSLTPEGRKRARREYHFDNRRAFDLGKNATIAGRALSSAQRKAQRKLVAYDKKPTRRRLIKHLAADATVEEMAKFAADTRAKAETNQKALVKKYGKEAVSSLKFDKHGRVNERIHTGSEIVAATLMNAAVATAQWYRLLPFGIYYIPGSKNAYGRKIRNDTYRRYRKKYKAMSDTNLK